MQRISSLLIAAAVALAGCTKKPGEAAPVAPAPAAEVNLAIWGNYLAPETEKLFTETTGIKLNVTNYASNEELLAKLQAGASGYDVAVPSDYMIDIMGKMGLLEKLDRAKIPNFKELSPEFLNQPFDPANDFSVPYAWSMTVIAVNRDLYKGPLKSWKDLFELPALAGKISFLDDAREVLGAALKSKGLSYNSTDPKEIQTAKDVLLNARKRVKMFRSDMVDALENKEVAAGQAFIADANQAWKKTGGKIDVIVPSEGTTFALDGLVIVKGAPHIENAHALINFFLQPKVNAVFVQNALAGPVLKGTAALLPAELKKNKMLFPGAAVMKKSERLKDLGEATRLYDEAWTEIKSR